MKNGKKPSLAQMKLMKSKGLSPTEWYVVKDTPKFMEVISKREISRCKMCKISGTKTKPKTRILEKTFGLLLAGCLAFAVPHPVMAMPEQEVEQLAVEIGNEYGICPELLQAIAYQESRYDENAEYEGCIGLMQVSEKWHEGRMKKLGVTDLCDPESNMIVAADYLSELFLKYEDVGMVLMVYNGDSHADLFYKTGNGLSRYANKILEHSEMIERKK